MTAQESRMLCAGEYLGYRLLELGVTHVFNVPGDFNLPVLDSLAKVPGLTLVNCASELNCAYAADGFARATGGLGVCVTTFLVGALSSINGIAASFAEEMPILSIVGVPSTRQYSGFHTLHHTLGNAEDMTQEVACHRPVTCYQTILRDLTDTRYLIDKALTKALNNRKPVLLEVCRDIPMVPHSSFGTAPPHMTPFSLPRAVADPATLEAAVAAVANFFQGKSRPLIVAGRRVRTCQDALLRFADAVGWGVMTLHDGKGMFPEDHPSYIGCFFPGFSSPASIATCYEAADAVFFIGTHFNEMSFGAPPDESVERRAVLAYKNSVLVGHTQAFAGIPTEQLLLHLAKHLPRAAPGTGLPALFHSLPATPTVFPVDPAFTAPPGVPLTLGYVYDRLHQELLAPAPPAGAAAGGYGLMVDTGDSMLRTHCMRLPRGTPYELQLFAGNIGWAAPAGLGFSLGLRRAGRRAIVLQGDGGLQMTAGEVGNYAKVCSNAIMVLVNNDGYLIERYISPISESGYNYPKRWDYALLAEAMCNKEGKYKVFKVRTEAEADAAIAAARDDYPDHFVFMEVVVDKRDAAPGAGALRAGFVGRHFSNMDGYRHLGLPGSAGGAFSSQTTPGSGLGALPASSGSPQGGVAASAGDGGCTPTAAAAAAATALTPSAVDAAALTARASQHIAADEAVSSKQGGLPPRGAAASGSSTCLAATAAAVGVVAAATRPASRLGTSPATSSSRKRDRSVDGAAE